jgi:hypothetical protein
MSGEGGDRKLLLADRNLLRFGHLAAAQNLPAAALGWEGKG